MWREKNSFDRQSSFLLALQERIDDITSLALCGPHHNRNSPSTVCCSWTSLELSDKASFWYSCNPSWATLKILAILVMDSVCVSKGLFSSSVMYRVFWKQIIIISVDSLTFQLHLAVGSTEKYILYLISSPVWRISDFLMLRLLLLSYIYCCWQIFITTKILKYSRGFCKKLISLVWKTLLLLEKKEAELTLLDPFFFFLTLAVLAVVEFRLNVEQYCFSCNSGRVLYWSWNPMMGMNGFFLDFPWNRFATNRIRPIGSSNLVLGHKNSAWMILYHIAL